MSSHDQTLRSFAGKLSLLLMFRRAVQWASAWFFVWGVVVLSARIAGGAKGDWLLVGLAGFAPLALFAALFEWRRREAFTRVRAAYDGLNQCGGLVMAQETVDTSEWQSALPKPAQPVVRWRNGRSLGLLLLSVVFVVVTLSLPERLTALGKRPLEVGKLVGELKAEVELLKEEKILDETKADELQKQLERLREDSSGLDPNKTWEALDHLKESNSELARQAAEEAITKMSSLSEAETLATALEQAAEAGMADDIATRAAQDLAGMLKAAKLEEGLLKGTLPSDLLSELKSLSKEDMEKLLDAIQANKGNLGRTVTNLANLRMIDAKMLGLCNSAGECPNPGGLAEFLSQCTNGSMSFAELAQCYGRGGVDRGRGDAPMTWKEESDPEGAKFKEEALPPSTRLEDSHFVGVSRTAPELTADSVETGNGALAGAKAGGGSANSRVVLPRHKQAVQRFFKRDE